MFTAELIGMTQSNDKKIYAITGGIGSGKTTVSQIIREKGFTVFSCDEIYSDLLADYSFLAKINEAVGFVSSDGKTLDRKGLSEKIFSDNNARERLNKVTHPVIIKELFQRIEKSQDEVVFCEVPLLFENGYEKLFDGVIVIICPLEKRIQTVMKRSNLTEEQIKSRIAAQYDYNKLSGNHYALYNDGGFDLLRENVTKILQEVT